MLDQVPVLQVSQYLAALNEVLHFQRAVIEGEVSDFKISQQKFVSFKLKDEQEPALLDCFLMIYQLPFPIKDGDKIQVAGYPRVYPKFGKLSFAVQSLTVSGEGSLKKAFIELQHKLTSEGVFADTHKQVLPLYPQTIGLITSKEGAVVHDILRTINDRWGGLTLLLYPVAVQGQQATAAIVSAIEHFNRHQPVDVLIVARGGGSLEDLQAFNSEQVVRAIFASRIPIVSGVGHEPDVTLCDLVADVRAPTPTAAAKLVVPDRLEVNRGLGVLTYTLVAGIEQVLADQADRLNRASVELEHAAKQLIYQAGQLFDRLGHQCDRFAAQLQFTKAGYTTAASRLNQQVSYLMERLTNQLGSVERTLHSVSPFAVLARGYSITLNEAGQAITDPKAVQAGQLLYSLVEKGKITSRIESTTDEPII